MTTKLTPEAYYNHLITEVGMDKAQAIKCVHIALNKEFSPNTTLNEIQ